MSDRAAAILSRLEEQKAALLVELEGWSLEKVRYRPGPQEWSAAQIVDHLVRTEVAILAAARNGLVRPHRIGLTDRLRTRFLERLFESNRRVKTPSSAKQIVPGSEPDLRVITADWKANRSDLRRFVESVPPDRQARGIFKHPVGGWMRVSDFLTFFSVHLIHHGYQITRLDAAFRVSQPTAGVLPPVMDEVARRKLIKKPSAIK